MKHRSKKFLSILLSMSLMAYAADTTVTFTNSDFEGLNGMVPFIIEKDAVSLTLVMKSL